MLIMGLKLMFQLPSGHSFKIKCLTAAASSGWYLLVHYETLETTQTPEAIVSDYLQRVNLSY